MARWEKPTKAISLFRLSDLAGNVWNLKKLQGKVVVIAVWASWSGPCHTMLPEFQQLCDEMQSRDDIQMLTMCMDEDLTAVKAFLEKNHFTFPVIPALVFVGQLINFVSVPRLWIIDSKSVWQWEQVGYDVNEQGWPAEVLKRIESVHVSSRGA